MSFATYQNVKKSGLDTIGLMPEHWAVRRLKFMVRIQNGKDYKDVVSEEGFPVIGSGGEFAKANKYLYNGESVLLGRKGTIDKPLYIDGPFWTVDTMFYTEINSDVVAKYLYYCALTINFLKYATSTALPSMTQQDLGGIPFAVPDHHEQSVIARFLDYKTAQIDALIAKKQTLLTKLAEKRTALISHAVTKGLDPSVPMKNSEVAWLGKIPEHWDVIRIRHCIEFLTSGSRGWAEYFAEEGSLFLRITNVTRDSIELKLDDVQYVSPPDGAEGRRTATLPGDVIISITADLGSVALIPESVSHAYVSQHLALLRPKKQKVSGAWLAYQAFSLSGKAQLLCAGYGGSKIQLGLGDVKDVWVAIPSVAEQNAISQHLELLVSRMNSQVGKVKTAIAALTEYRAALITNAVTGKIDVRNFNMQGSANMETVNV